MSERIRTYGVDTETMKNLSEFLYTNLYTKILENSHKAEDLDIMLEVLKCYPDQVHGIIIATAIFCIGNFDRIDKIERWAEIDTNGQIDNSILKEFKSGMIV